MEERKISLKILCNLTKIMWSIFSTCIKMFADLLFVNLDLTPLGLLPIALKANLFFTSGLALMFEGQWYYLLKDRSSLGQVLSQALPWLKRWSWQAPFLNFGLIFLLYKIRLVIITSELLWWSGLGNSTLESFRSYKARINSLFSIQTFKKKLFWDI